MPFLGSTPAEQYKSLAKQTITGDGSTAYTLNRSVTNAYDMEVYINNVRQEPDTSYTASGNTITFTAAVTSGDSCYLIYQGQSVGSINPPAGSVGGTQIQNTSVTNAHLAGSITDAKLHSSLDLSSKTLTMPAGHVIQVQSTNMTTHQTITGTSFTEITDLTTNITPISTSSKIYLMVHLVVGDAQDDNYSQFRIQRVISGSSTNLGLGTAAGSSTLCSWQNNGPYNHAVYETHVSSWTYLDSPATTLQTTYKVFSRPMATSSRTHYINRPHETSDANRAVSSSTLTLMEIAQ